MSTTSLQTDFWVETSDPIVNLSTDEWFFQLTLHPSFTLSTDLYAPEFVPFSRNTYFQVFYFVGATADGEVHTLNTGKDDNGTPIYYEVETHELEFGNRSHLKQISDHMQVLTRFGLDSAIMGKVNDEDYRPIVGTLDRRVNIVEVPSLKGHYFKFKWSGTSSSSSPILDGIVLEDITDLGLTNG